MWNDDAGQVIAISGKSGCGNSTVTGLVAERLGLRVVNYTFHNLAEDLGLSFADLCKRAESDGSYDLSLDAKQVDLAKRGNCVVGSRLAIWLMRNFAFTVYLFAPAEVRATRIRRREGGTYQSVFQATIDRDRRDRERYLRLYAIDNDDYQFADLIVDAGTRDQYAISDLIVREVRQPGGRR
jgi:cytidylate kinase